MESDRKQSCSLNTRVLCQENTPPPSLPSQPLQQPMPPTQQPPPRKSPPAILPPAILPPPGSPVPTNDMLTQSLPPAMLPPSSPSPPMPPLVPPPVLLLSLQPLQPVSVQPPLVPPPQSGSPLAISPPSPPPTDDQCDDCNCVISELRSVADKLNLVIRKMDFFLAQQDMSQENLANHVTCLHSHENQLVTVQNSE